MRRTPSTRLGALGLGLLLQLFVASSLLHPCCLAMGMEGGGVSTAVAEAPVPSDHHGHGAPAHGGGHHDADLGTGAHSGHGGQDHDNGCDGACGLCCQVAGVLGLPATPATVASPDLASVATHAVARPDPLRSATAYLLPWANAPPTPRSVSA